MHDAPIPPSRPSRSTSGSANTTGWFVLLWVAWVLVPLGLAGSALGNLLTFFGELPTDAEEAQARQLFLLAAAVAVAIPVVGLIMSLRAGRQGSAAAFVVAGASPSWLPWRSSSARPRRSPDRPSRRTSRVVPARSTAAGTTAVPAASAQSPMSAASSPMTRSK